MVDSSNDRRKPAASYEPLFDLAYWLGNTQAVYRANRASVKNLVPLSELPDALDRLVARGVIRHEEADDLINDLKEEYDNGQ